MKFFFIFALFLAYSAVHAKNQLKVDGIDAETLKDKAFAEAQEIIDQVEIDFQKTTNNAGMEEIEREEKELENEIKQEFVKAGVDPEEAIQRELDGALEEKNLQVVNSQNELLDEEKEIVEIATETAKKANEKAKKEEEELKKKEEELNELKIKLDMAEMEASQYKGELERQHKLHSPSVMAEHEIEAMEKVANEVKEMEEKRIKTITKEAHEIEKVALKIAGEQKEKAEKLEKIVKRARIIGGEQFEASVEHKNSLYLLYVSSVSVVVVVALIALAVKWKGIASGKSAGASAFLFTQENTRKKAEV